METLHKEALEHILKPKIVNIIIIIIEIRKCITLDYN